MKKGKTWGIQLDKKWVEVTGTFIKREVFYWLKSRLLS
jgi:hypothetical protein